MKDRQHGESLTSEENVVALDQLPFDLTTELGAVAAAEEISPGVYRISTNKTETRYAYSEYYVVTQNAQAVSDKARSYGKVFTEKPGLYVYDLSVPKSGWHIVSFEILRHQKNTTFLCWNSRIQCMLPQSMEWKNILSILVSFLCQL